MVTSLSPNFTGLGVLGLLEFVVAFTLCFLAFSGRPRL